MGEDKRTVGYPLAHHEVKVVGESGQTLPVEEMGEIWVRGPCRFLCYRNDEAKTQDVLDCNGWVHTGWEVITTYIYISYNFKQVW